MKKILTLLLALVLMMSFTASSFATDQIMVARGEGIRATDFNEFGIREGVDILPEGLANRFATLASAQWETLPEKYDVSLSKEWTVKFNQSFSINDIDGMVIEREGVFIPVRIRLFPTAKEVKVNPGEMYLPNARYCFKIFLNNGKRYKMYFNTSKEQTYSEYGNTGGNISNSGIVAEKDDWIYYSNSNDNYSLYKIKQDGTQKTKLNSDRVSYINVMGGWVYYRNDSDKGYLYRIRTDGTDRTRLVDHEAKFINVVDNGWIYYVTGTVGTDSIYAIRLDGSNRVDMWWIDGKYPVVSDGWIYLSLVSSNSSNTYSRLYKYSLSNDTFTRLTEERVSHINLVGNWIYYINLDDNRIYKISKDGADRMRLSDSWCESLNVYNGKAYYVNAEDRSIYRINLDGTSEQRLNDSPSSSVNIITDWIYYRDPTTGYYYRMHLDGSDWEKVE